MTRDEYIENLARAWMFARIIETLPLAEMVKVGDKAADVVWFLDPTLARDLAANAKFEPDRRLLRAMWAVKQELERQGSGAA